MNHVKNELLLRASYKTNEQTNLFLQKNDDTKTKDSIPNGVNVEKICSNADQKPEIKTNFPTNLEILDLLQEIQPHIDTFESTLSTLRTWLELKKRKYETGHSFGSDVIEEISKQIKTYGELGNGINKQSYFETRVRLCGEIEKNPGAQDGPWTVDILDGNLALGCRDVLIKMRTSYLIVFDLLKKNWTTVLNADGAGEHGQGHEMMYSN